MKGGTLFIVTMGVVAVFLVGCLALNLWLSKRLKLPAGVSKAVLIASFFAGLAGILFGGSLLKAAHDMGGVRRLFILPTRSGSGLAVWCTRIYGKRSGADYEHYIRTFDLMTGKHLGSIRIDPRYLSDEYRLYWPGGDRAWGYRKGPGVTLIDLAVPQIIADNARIVKQNPALGPGFTFKAYIDSPDPGRTGLYVKSADGRLYKLNEDLSTFGVSDLPAGGDLNREWTFKANWDFYPLKTSKGEHAHTRGAPCNADGSLTLLEPSYLPEFNFAVKQKERTWVRHKSAILGDYDWLVSYMEGDGTALSTINVSKLIQGEPLTVIGTHTLENEILIFITTGRTFRSNIVGFSLAALSTDPRTGELSRRISFF